MYSMVLMAAVASSGDAASFHWKSAGCHGCYGARSAPVVYSVGCYGTSHAVGGCRGCTGCSGYVPYSTSCFGCSGGSCFGSGYSCSGCCGGIVNWSSPVIEHHAHPIGTTVQPASLEIELPAGATLFVDGRMVPGTGSVRTFSTPELPAGKTYYYDMKAEVTVDGKVVHEEHRVVVRGGESLKQSFGELIARAKSATPSDLAKK